MPADLNGCRFETGYITLGFFHIFNLVLMRFRPAAVHAEQHLGPVLRFSTAAAGMNFQIGVVGVDFAGKQRLKLAAARLLLQFLKLLHNLGNNRFVALLFGHFCQTGQIVKSGLHFLKVCQRRFKIVFFRHQFLRFFGVVPKLRILGQRVQLIKPENCVVVVKETSSAIPTIA